MLEGRFAVSSTLSTQPEAVTKTTENFSTEAELSENVSTKDSMAGSFQSAVTGPQGDKGDKGDTGTSAYCSVVQADDGAIITATDANGTTTAKVSNGKDGSNVTTPILTMDIDALFA